MDRTKSFVMFGLLAGLLLGFMDVTIVSTAGPTIVSDLGGVNLYAWVFASFVIVQVVTIPIFSKLADLYGRKKIFLLGVIVFMLGSILSGAAQNISEMILFRAVQGIGFGAFLPTTVAIAGEMFPPEKRGKIQSLLFSINGIAFAIAPALGSFLTDALSWRWIFYINLPIGLVSFVLILIKLQGSNATSNRGFSDRAGAATLAGFLGMLMFGLYLGGNALSWASWQEAALFAGSGILLAAFIFAERRAGDPILPPRIMRTRNISAATAVNLLRAMVFFGIIAYIPLFAQAVLAANINEVRNVAYALMLPLTGGIIFSGAIISRIGFKKSIFTGATATVIGLILLALADGPKSITELMEILVPVGFGSGMMIPASIVAFQNSVQKSDIGIASGLSTFTLFLGSAVGVAVLGTIQTSIFGSKLAGILANASAESRKILGDPNVTGQILASSQTLSHTLASHPTLTSIVPTLRSAFSQSIIPLFWIELGISVATLASAFLIKEAKQ